MIYIIAAANLYSVLAYFAKMGYKKIDNRLRILMENGITQGHRSMFLIVGPKARDQASLDELP